MDPQIPTAPALFGPTLTSLPTEIHLLIASNLTYPDALSLKHTNRHFYNIVYTGINLKIEWLIERRRLHLDCPHDRRCELGSDLRFCRGSVRLLMKRRREHGECEKTPGGRGCLVFGTKVCTYSKPVLSKVERVKNISVKLFGKLRVVLLWLSLASLGAGIAYIWGSRESQRRNALSSNGGAEVEA